MVGSLMYLSSIGCSGIGASFTFSKIPTMYAVVSLADRTGQRHQEQKTPPAKMVYAMQWWIQEMQFYLDGQDEEAGRLLQIELMVRSKVAGDSPVGTARVPISTLIMTNSTAIGLLKEIRCQVRTSDRRPVGVLALSYVIYSYPVARIPPPSIPNVGFFNHPLLLAPARESFSVRKKFNGGRYWWNLEESVSLNTRPLASHQFGESGECSSLRSGMSSLKNTSWSAWGVNHFSPAYNPAASPAVGFYREQQPAVLPYPVSELVRGQLLSKPEIHGTQNQTGPSEQADLARIAEKAGKNLQTIPQYREPAIPYPLPDLDVQGQLLSKPEIHGTQNQTDPSEKPDLARVVEKTGKSLRTIPESQEPAIPYPLPDLDVQGQLLSKPEIHGTQNQTDPSEKPDLARVVEKTGKSLRTLPESQEPAVPYPLLDLDVQGQLLSKPEIHGTQNPTDPIEKADLARIGEKAGKSLQTISESQEFASEDDGGFIFDTSVGKIDLSNLQVLNNKDIVEVKELGSGAFGTVYHGKWRGVDVAIKRINKNCFTSQQDRLILESLKEVGILANLLHPNIVSLYGIVLDEPGSNTLAIVTELVANGSLRNILHREDKFDHYRKLIIAKGAASGMEYLHLKKIVHFDLKCDNLLVDLKDPSSPICKVADFGLSKVKQDTLVSGGVRGTIPWMAPELLKGDRSKVSEKVDVFSFGIVMWEILTGEVPYAGMLEGEILGGIYNDTLRPPMPTSCEPRWRRLMEECWASNPQERPSFTQIARQLHSMSVDSHAEAGQ